MMESRQLSKSTRNSVCPLTASPSKRATVDQQVAAVEQYFPKGMSKPALRALTGAGYTKLEQLINATEDEILALHGMGPKAMFILKTALNSQGKKFRTQADCVVLIDREMS
jgi:hypothetical protein